MVVGLTESESLYAYASTHVLPRAGLCLATEYRSLGRADLGDPPVPRVNTGPDDHRGRRVVGLSS